METNGGKKIIKNNKTYQRIASNLFLKENYISRNFKMLDGQQITIQIQLKVLNMICFGHKFFSFKNLIFPFLFIQISLTQ